MFKTKISLMLLAMVAVLTLCSFATQAQTGGESERVNVDSLITDSATVADGVKLVTVISNGPVNGNVAPWLIAVLLAGIAVYRHIKSVEYKKTIKRIQGNRYMTVEQFASKVEVERQFKEGTHPAQEPKRKAGNPDQPRKGGKFTKREPDGHKDY